MNIYLSQNKNFNGPKIPPKLGSVEQRFWGHRPLAQREMEKCGRRLGFINLTQISDKFSDENFCRKSNHLSPMKISTGNRFTQVRPNFQWL